MSIRKKFLVASLSTFLGIAVLPFPALYFSNAQTVNAETNGETFEETSAPEETEGIRPLSDDLDYWDM